MKVLLLNTPPRKRLGITGELYPPLGILCLASYAREHLKDLELKVIDGYLEDYDTLPDKILEFTPNILGISFGTQSASSAYEIINKVKSERPDIKVIAGGPHPTALPEEVLIKSKADIVVTGEGEITFTEILTRIKNGDEPDSILGTVVRSKGLIKRNPQRQLIMDLDSIPFPARDLLNITRYRGHSYKKRKKDTSLISSRGCPFACTFCSNPVWKYQKPWFRARSPKNVVDEMEQIIRDYGLSEFYDFTDNLNSSKQWVIDLCTEILERKLDISWKAQMRVTNVDENLARALEKSGFWLAFFGLESSNDRTLKGINKKQTIQQIEEGLEVLKRTTRIKAVGFFIAFNVWEEENQLCYEHRGDVLATLDYAKKLLRQRKIDMFGWSLVTPYPGSKLYETALKHGLISQEVVGRWEFVDPGAGFLMNLPGISRKDWLEVLNVGRRLQARSILTSNLRNWRSLPLYLRKAFYLVKMNIEQRMVRRTKKE